MTGAAGTATETAASRSAGAADCSGDPEPARPHRPARHAATLAALADGDLARAGATSPVELTEWLAGPDCVGTWRVAPGRPSRPRPTCRGSPACSGTSDEQRPVGKAGFHAAPDPDGLVEVGYAVDPAYRRRATPAPPSR